jgi:hypothetical protein
MLIALKPFIVPRSTSAFMLAPGYEKPLLQKRWNTNGDRASWVKELDALPPGIPASASAQERHPDYEMQRLATTYGIATFRAVYPNDDLFVRAFESCQTVTLPSQDNAVPLVDQSREACATELLHLNVPTLNMERALKIVDAGQTLDSLPNTDSKGLAGVTGLPLNLIRSTIEAAKLRAPQRASGAPSAPTMFKPSVEPVPA